MKRKALFIVAFLFMFIFVGVAVFAYEASEDQVKWAANKSTSICKLTLKENVRTILLENKEDFLNVLRAEFRKEYPEKRYETLEKIGDKIGFYIKKIETEDEILQSESEGIAGLYDDEEKAIYIVTEKLERELEAEAAARTERKCGYKEQMDDDKVWYDWIRKHQAEFTLVHEVTHAIQDQYYSLKEWKDQYDANTDAFLAIKTVIEGMAEYTDKYYFYDEFGVAYLLNDYDFYKVLNWIREGESEYGTFSAQNVCGEDVSYQYRLSSFPYNYGTALVQKMYWKKGWNGVHDLHFNYPMSTEQVIHPDKFFEPKQIDWPTFIYPPDLTGVLPSNFVFQDTDSLGEFRIYLLLLDLMFEAREAIRISEGWDGDRYLVFEDPDSEDFAFIWLTVWDNQKEADEFFDFYHQIIERKKVGGEFVESKADRYIFKTTFEMSSVTRKGNLILVTEGVNDKGLIGKVGDAMFGAEIYEATYDDEEIIPDYYAMQLNAKN